MARSGIGTVVARRTTTKGKEYKRTWIYVPSKISQDNAFPFESGQPCKIDIVKGERHHLTVKPIAGETRRRK